MQRKPNEPNQAVAIALLQAGHSAEESLRIAGYNFSSADGARSKASKLLRQAPTHLPVHPAVAALDPTRRAIWDALTKKAQDWVFPDAGTYCENETHHTVDGDLSLPEQLSTPWNFMPGHWRTGQAPPDCPRKPWDALSRRQEQAAKRG